MELGAQTERINLRRKRWHFSMVVLFCFCWETQQFQFFNKKENCVACCVENGWCLSVYPATDKHAEGWEYCFLSRISIWRSSYWSSPQALRELGHLLGDPCKFVHKCFLKPDPKSEGCDGQNCLTDLLKLKAKLNEKKGWALLLGGCQMVGYMGQPCDPTSQTHCTIFKAWELLH